ncbi:hypothetical protein QF000_006976 [Paraburkholderia atlantica]|uniref:hypothetical protein n=1 Tax=Paraburkholderia atlantica TaxID=2654982 RepID=UPI003D251E5E
MHTSFALNADTMHEQREYFGRQAAMERTVLAAVRAGRADGMDEHVRAVVAAVRDLSEAQRGLAVRDLMVDDDPHRGLWLVLVELASGDSRAITVRKPAGPMTT